MPSRNVLKISVENSYYHIYNRGVEKRKIFLDDQDYSVFLNYIKEALSPPPEKIELKKITITVQGTSFDRYVKPVKNFRNKIELLAYCLMPNHFHFLIKQIEKGQMEIFMRSLITRYARYFNKKYDRVGPLFQGRYKAIMIQKDSYLLHLTRYIHLNPQELTNNLINTYSSYSVYLGLNKAVWITPEFILKFFNKTKNPDFIKQNSYKDFVENYEKDSAEILGEATLE